MATMVLDAHALMVLFNDEPGAEEVEKILLKAESGNPTLLMSVVNWGEIYYSIMRGASQEIADSKSHEIAGMRIVARVHRHKLNSHSSDLISIRTPNHMRSLECELSLCRWTRATWNWFVKRRCSRQARKCPTPTVSPRPWQ